MSRIELIGTSRSDGWGDESLDRKAETRCNQQKIVPFRAGPRRFPHPKKFDCSDCITPAEKTE